MLPAATEYEMSRDLCLMACTDLLPFSIVSRVGVKNFFAKNLKDDVKKLLAETVAVRGTFCLMFDGWCDKYFGRSYLGLRVTFIHPTSWQSHVKTLSIKVLNSHTAQSLASHIQNELDDFRIRDRRKCTLFSAHDGAANMMKCSKLLQVSAVVHCVAHSIHLLLKVDSLYQVSDVVDVIKKCKDIVNGLHFKGCTVEDESFNERDWETMNDLIDRIHNANELLSFDERLSDGLAADVNNNNDTAMVDEPQEGSSKTPRHVHRSLKREIPTRYSDSGHHNVYIINIFL